MRMLMAFIALWLAAGAAAQPADAPEPVRRRAPLANVEDLEPAVDVGALRVAAVEPAAAPAAAPLTPPAQPVAPAAPPPSSSRAMDSLNLGTTSITGNQELPKVLYIVPWKKSDLGDLVGRPATTLLDEVLAPLDPAVFERHLDYYETLNEGTQGVR